MIRVILALLTLGILSVGFSQNYTPHPSTQVELAQIFKGYGGTETLCPGTRPTPTMWSSCLLDFQNFYLDTGQPGRTVLGSWDIFLPWHPTDGGGWSIVFINFERGEMLMVTEGSASGIKFAIFVVGSID